MMNIHDDLPIKVLSRDAVEIDHVRIPRARAEEGASDHSYLLEIPRQIGWRYILRLMDEYQGPPAQEPEPKPLSGRHWEPGRTECLSVIGIYQRDCELRDRLLALEKKMEEPCR